MEVHLSKQGYLSLNVGLPRAFKNMKRGRAHGRGRTALSLGSNFQKDPSAFQAADGCGSARRKHGMQK